MHTAWLVGQNRTCARRSRPMSDQLEFAESALGISRPPCGRFQRGFDGYKRQQQADRRVRQRHSAITRVPFCCPLVLGVDKKGDAAYFRRRQQTAPSRCEQKLSAKALPLYLAIHSQARQPE